MQATRLARLNFEMQLYISLPSPGCARACTHGHTHTRLMHVQVHSQTTQANTNACAAHMRACLRRERERSGANRILCSTALQEAGIGPRAPDYAQGTLGEDVGQDALEKPPSPPLSNMAASRASRPRRYSATYATTHALPIPHPPLNSNQVARRLVSVFVQASACLSARVVSVSCVPFVKSTCVGLV